MELKNFLKGLFYKIAALLFVAGAAQATQNTQFQPLGYSEQGRYFAYEEYGLDEQSGHGFSTIYITDLIQVSHVVGTPITFEAPIDELSLLAIREQALIKAKVFLNSLDISVPAQTIVMIGDGQPNANKEEIEFGIPIAGHTNDVIRRISGLYILSLEAFEAPSTLRCDEFMQSAPLGFALKLANFGTGVEVYRDTVLARSRGCPFQYELTAVILPFGATDVADSVGLVSVDLNGQNGMRRHFLAIPLAFNIAGQN